MPSHLFLEHFIARDCLAKKLISCELFWLAPLHCVIYLRVEVSKLMLSLSQSHISAYRFFRLLSYTASYF